MKKILAVLLAFLLLPMSFSVQAEEDSEYGYVARLSDSDPSAPPAFIFIADRETAEQYLAAGYITFYEPNFPVYLPEAVVSSNRSVSLLTADYWQHTAIRLPENTGVDGSGIVVGILDSGVSAHIDFGSRLLTGYNILDDSTNTVDNIGHGTRVAGMVASTSVGIAPGASIYPVKCFDSGVDSYAIDILNAMTKAMLAGCDILNLSLGFPSFTSASEYTSFAETIEYAEENGILIVAAVGNEGGTTVMYPAGLDGVIGVGAVSKTAENAYTRATYSQNNASVDIVAPGNCIGAPDKDSETDYVSSSDLTRINGTSFASPIIAGVLALGLSYAPTLNPNTVADALLSTARDMGAPGLDNEYGYGLADVTGFLAELDRTDTTHMLPCPGGISIYRKEAGTAQIFIAQYDGDNELHALLHTQVLTLPAGYTEFDVTVPKNTRIFLFDKLHPLCPPLKY
ncbi:MAG: hypothetical protein E7408_03920 [Ruminococcaceae bacterium]|nr:hypothetical protein [Oscillospiraceae bacterium]